MSATFDPATLRWTVPRPYAGADRCENCNGHGWLYGFSDARWPSLQLHPNSREEAWMRQRKPRSMIESICGDCLATGRQAEVAA